MQSLSSDRVVLVATGGTIAGTAARQQDHVGYTAGALGADDLVAAVPALQGLPLEALTLARLDSCDMDHATWQALARCLAAQLARPEVAGVVVTHGTDTLEETAYFLHRTLRATKPVVLTAAMRPATAASPDGPQNLIDAVTLARWGAMPVARRRRACWWCWAARCWPAPRCARCTATASTRSPAVTPARWRCWKTACCGASATGRPRRPCGPMCWSATRPPGRWSTSSPATPARAARWCDALVAAGAQGLVIAGTGNGSVHRQVLEAARRAEAQGVRVWRASRCLLGGVVGSPPGALPSAGPLTPAQARVELLLDLLAARSAASA